MLPTGPRRSVKTTGLFILAQPFTGSFGKPLTKSPEICFGDTGLVCHLLGLRSATDLSRSPFASPLFENHVACEFVKAQQHHARRRELSSLRVRTGIEDDFAVPVGSRRLVLVEAKRTRTLLPKTENSMRLFMKAAKGYNRQDFIVHPGADLIGTGGGERVRALCGFPGQHSRRISSSAVGHRWTIACRVIASPPISG